MASVPKPIDDSTFLKAMAEAIEARASELVEEEVSKVADRVAERLRSQVNVLALNLLKKFSIENGGGQELLIRVDTRNIDQLKKESA